MKFNMIQLPFGAICPADDCNFPPRAAALGDIDIDNQIPGVGKAAGLVPGDVVVDIGAFVGDTACALARFGAEVYAFEPFFDSYLALHYNTQVWFQRNNPTARPIHCFNSPVGNGERVRYVYECPGPNFGMRSVQSTTNAADAISTVRIDDLHLPNCKLMKVDCEGSEIPALLGAAETIKRCRPVLFVEMYEDGLKARGYTPEDLESTIRGLGYNLEMWGAPPRWDWFCRPLPVDSVKEGLL